MSSILFVVDKYWPEPNAITFCLDKIVDYFKNDRRVAVFTTKNTKNEPFYETMNGVGVYRTKNSDYLKESNYARNLNAPFSKKAPAKVTHKLLSLRRKGLDENYRATFNCETAAKDLQSAIEKERPDAVISVSFPFSAHELVNDVRKKTPGFKWIIYELDPYAYSCFLPKENIEQRKLAEREAVADADAVITLVGIKEENERHSFLAEFGDKIHSLPLPNISVSGGFSFTPQDVEFRLLHTGNAYSKKYFEFLREVCAHLDVPVRCVLCGLGSAQYAVSGDNLTVDALGFVSDEQKKSETDACGALLLLGDPRTNQFPSKLAYYVSTGKPVLHLRCSDDDPCLPLLEKYGNYVSIDAGEDPESAAKTVSDFIARASEPSSLLDADEIRKRLRGWLTDDVCEKIRELTDSLD